MTFELHARLAADTFAVASLELSELLLMNDARFPWCILVPRLGGLRDLHEVPPAHKPTLLAEIDQVSAMLMRLTGAYKMNVAALGNMVEQLHVHVIARQRDDAAWPQPVWGAGDAQPYAAAAAARRIEQLRTELG